ncbi:hypothetical protein CDAR_42491 [Caerostris darwini]|uniref:Uncharacterized protein n=1 Tax=Caerostris darwini TaxID=1538125 RepID=A0AAV4RFL4_9ARAC|nr:hypothetical protein CDAR_42491 [Caerostris darwini]
MIQSSNRRQVTSLGRRAGERNVKNSPPSAPPPSLGSISQEAAVLIRDAEERDGRCNMQIPGTFPSPPLPPSYSAVRRSVPGRSAGQYLPAPLLFGDSGSCED